jgi:Xaa-Pro aminopeptidase/Xaa-Pro dipeptidase
MKIDELGMDAALILDIQNIRYFTGFTGSEGALLAGKGRMCLLVDGRYITQARFQAVKAEVVQFKQKIPEIARIINDWDVASVSVEAGAISYQQYLELTNGIPRLAINPLGPEFSRIRAIKDDDEIDLIRKAACISAEALNALRGAIKPGISERDLALELEYRMGRSGSEGVSFETIVASGENSALPHARPGLRKLRKGDLVIFDYGSICGGYHSDETCTFGIGEISDKQTDVYNIVKEAHDRALAHVKSGVPCRIIDEAARAYIDSKGFGANFLHGTGHGVGLEVHEFPKISFLGEDTLETGMVITVEPGIYISGSFGVRIESLVLVGDKGCEILSQIDKKLDIID